MKTWGSTFAGRLKAFRDEAKFTQLEFGTAIGASRASVNRWERGAAGAVSLDQAEAICKKLKKPLTEFLPPEVAAPREPTNADLLEEIRSLRAVEPSDPFIREAIVLLGKIDKTKHRGALAALKSFVDVAAQNGVAKRGKLS